MRSNIENFYKVITDCESCLIHERPHTKNCHAHRTIKIRQSLVIYTYTTYGISKYFFLQLNLEITSAELSRPDRFSPLALELNTNKSKNCTSQLFGNLPALSDIAGTLRSDLKEGMIERILSNEVLTDQCSNSLPVFERRASVSRKAASINVKSQADILALKDPR